MSFLNRLKGQFIDVIEWMDDSDDILVYRFPDRNREIMMGAQLTVRETQCAIFINEGKLADIFTPGRYELSTQNLPILTKLKSWKFGFNSPFKSEVYFVNTRQFINQKWGTSNPVMMRDTDFGIVRLRAFGSYSFRIGDPETFLVQLLGTNDVYTVDRVSEQIKRFTVSAFSDALASSGIAALDLAAKYDELSVLVGEKLKEKLAPLGLYATDVTVENISLPPEVEAAMDKRTSMGAVGDLNKYQQYQAAEALRDAAKNEGGMAGMGAGMAAAAMFSGMMNQQMQQSAQAASAAPAPAAQQGGRHCTNCGHKLDGNYNFCPECGSKQGNACKNCNAPLQAGAKFCPECGSKQG